MVLIVQRSYLAIVLMLWFVNVSLAKAPVLSSKEQVLVNKLRSLVINKLTANYMKSDAYLVKWLKAKDYDVNAAKESLEKTLIWRKETKADTLPYEDFSHLSKQYVLDFSVRDTSGRPVVLIPFGDWNIRRKALVGKVVSDLGGRLDFMEEKAAQLAYNLTGDSTSMLISDLNGFSFTQHGCAGCVPFYLNWVRHHEIHYPYNFYKVICINTPAIFDPILRLMRPLMTASTRDAFRTVGFKREEFMKDILETVAPEVLPYRFGGTKKSKT